MPTIERFEDIRVWQTARALTREIYAVSNQGTFGRDFGLRDQVRRAAVSILSNVAEGFESGTRPQLVRYLTLAKGSAGELRAQLRRAGAVALDAGYLDPETFAALFDQAEKCSGQLAKFISYLKANPDQNRLREGTIEYDINP